MKDAPLLHRIEYAVFVTFERLLRLVGHRGARRLGSGLGALLWSSARTRRRVALENLERALPELTERERYRIARGSFLHLGRNACDIISARRFDAVELCRRLTLEGWEHFAAARSRGRGVLMMSAHLGTWEIAAYPVGLYAEPMHVIGRPLDNPLLDRHLTRIRTRFGNRTIPKRGAARGTLAVLAEGGVVGILIDQRVYPAEGEPLPFFGEPALTSTLLARLAIRYGTRAGFRLCGAGGTLPSVVPPSDRARRSRSARADPPLPRRRRARDPRRAGDLAVDAPALGAQAGRRLISGAHIGG